MTIGAWMIVDYFIMETDRTHVKLVSIYDMVVDQIWMVLSLVLASLFRFSGFTPTKLHLLTLRQSFPGLDLGESPLAPKYLTTLRRRKNHSRHGREHA